MSNLRSQQTSGFGLERPDADALVLAGGGDHLACRVDGETIDAIERVTHRIQALSGCNIPHFDASIRCARDETRSVGRERKRVYSIDVILESFDLFARCSIPELDQLVVTRRRQYLAIGRKCDGIDA